MASRHDMLDKHTSLLPISPALFIPKRCSLLGSFTHGHPLEHFFPLGQCSSIWLLMFP